METIEFKDVAHLYVGCMLRKGSVLSHLLIHEANEAAFNAWDDIKPILRPLSDMSNDEIWKLNEITKAGSWNLEMIKNIKSVFNLIHATPIVFLELTKLNFDLFGLIESGEAIDKAKLSQNTPNQ